MRCGRCKADGPEIDVAHVRACYANREQFASPAQRTLVAEPPVPPAELEDGIYRNPLTGKIYKVYVAVHGSGKLCAKELVVDSLWVRDDDGNVISEGKSHFEYRGLAERFVRPGQKMSLEQAKEFGALYGVCCRCSATLTDEKSIAAGIGPVCARKI